MVRRRRQDGDGLAEPAVDVFETPQETWNRARTYREVSPHYYISPAQFARNDADTIRTLRVFDPKHFLGKVLAKTAMEFPDSFRRNGAAAKSTAVDPIPEPRYGLLLPTGDPASWRPGCNRP